MQLPNKTQRDPETGNKKIFWDDKYKNDQQKQINWLGSIDIQ